MHWRLFLAKTSATATEFLLALATLGDATQIGSFLFYVVPPKVAKASKEGVISQAVITLNFANGNTA